MTHLRSPARAKGTSAADKQIPVGTKVLLDEAGLQAFLSLLLKIGYTPIGPKVRDGAVVYEPITSITELPVGIKDEQEGGHYRLSQSPNGSFFDYTVGPTSWKKYLFPPVHKMWSAEKQGGAFKVIKDKKEEPAYAFIGVRSCELNAIHIQDKVFGFDRADHCEKGIFSDPGYVARRSKSLIIAVNCGRANKTCFCTSMGGSPHVTEGQGYDLALTELHSSSHHEFIVEVGSERGALILDLLPYKPVTHSHVSAEQAQERKARHDITRKMPDDVKTVLKKNIEHPRWDSVADRCLSCANCTMVCPTCFCSTVEERTDLTGDHSERWRMWDSCFSIDFSYIHGGAIRSETKSRYRQWMTHKLSNWHDQFNSSGCVGCGRCITWCPVGIDITEEAQVIKRTGK
ncbi:MAG: 4Fe-4S dicluster domain-containing protein [Alphaproteobacteria bacterium]|nr:4Fe-4S dicluster domain-containing protein [Alphaproteobacteria bacterium]